MTKRREVDIRLFDTTIGTYVDTKDLRISSIKDEKYIPQLYTGCKDSKGTKIFEGDIVECNAPVFEPPKKLTIKWSQTKHSFNLPSPDLKKYITITGNNLTN